MRIRLLLTCLVMTTAVACKITRTLPQTATSPQVRFESAIAAQTFYEALIRYHFPDPEGRSLTLQLAPLDINKEKVRDSGSILAEAVSGADSNRDALITESEAKSFASSLGS
jgi:hypothetical protein